MSGAHRDVGAVGISRYVRALALGDTRALDEDRLVARCVPPG